MTKMTKSLMILSVICLAIGGVLNLDLFHFQNADALYAVLPVGAVLFGLFLISRILEKETRQYDEEHESHPAVQSSRKSA